MSAVPRPATAAINIDSPDAARAALRTFWRLSEAWKLGVAEQATLLGVGRTTLYQWKKGGVGPLDRHVLERLSYLFGIYAALQILLPIARAPGDGGDGKSWHRHVSAARPPEGADAPFAGRERGELRAVSSYDLPPRCASR